MNRGAVWIGAVVAVWSTRAFAEDRRITEARAAYQAQEPDRTATLLTPLLATTSLDEGDRAAALRLAGCAHMVLGERAAAIARFRESFALEPDAALEPSLASSPDARGLFEVARGEWRAALVTEMEGHAAEIAKLGLVTQAPTGARGGTPLVIAVKFVDATHLVSRVELGYRRRGQDAFTLLAHRIAKPATAPLRFSISAEATASSTPFVLEYHVTLRHRTGYDLRRDGDPDRPHVMSIAPGRIPRWHDSWLVRSMVGLGVVGLGVGGYLFYRSLDVGPQSVAVQ